MENLDLKLKNLTRLVVTDKLQKKRGGGSLSL